MAQVHLPLAPQRGFAETSRKDNWWGYPLVVFLGFSAFIVYTTWAGFQNANYTYEGYLSPFYSPVLWGDPGHAWFGPGTPSWWPGALPYSPAFLILIAPAGFRLTCYYYRGAYYKSFWLSPPACAVGKPHNTYTGERSFPLIIQNIHRYFMYLAVIYIFILSYDAYRGMWFETAGGGHEFGIGLGTIVLILNVVFIGLYTFGCHSFRHAIGGFKDIMSKLSLRRQAYRGSTWCNERHMRWAWTSLLWVMFTDVYIRMCAMGIWSDWRII